MALWVALLCALFFDYYFLPPLRTLQIVGIQQWVAMISFLLSCVVVSRVAERARGQARQADARREDVERLYELSQQMMLQEDAAGLIRDLRWTASCFTSATRTSSTHQPPICR
jgi:two-component system sensor histidine kinase KdpD